MEVFLTRRALKQYRAIKKYIVGEWGANSGNKFEQRVSLILDLLASFPELGTLEVEHQQIRGFQLSKQTRIFYRIKSSHLIILAFFDVRQSPVKKPD